MRSQNLGWEALELRTPYQLRSVRSLGRDNLDGWAVKVYGISARRVIPLLEVLRAGKRVARRALPDPPVCVGCGGSDRYGVAILIVHEARDGNFVLVSWWTAENMLSHRVYHAPPGSPLDFEDFGGTDIVACVWELAVLSFERDAWVECVLAPAEADLDAYLDRTFEGDI